VAVAVQALLHSKISEQFHVNHLDLADRRGIQHVNKPDMHDVALFIRQWLKLIGMLLRTRPDLTYLVLSQSTIGFLRDSLLLWPAWLRGSCLVVHLHGGNFRDWLQQRSWIMQTYVRTVMSRVTRTIVLGDSLKGQFDGVVTPQNISVVSNGIDWSDFDVSTRTARRTSRFQVLHLSTLSHLKGALVLIQAIPSILRHHPNVEFICAGPWSHAEDKQWAEVFIAEQGIADHVRFTGQVDGDEKKALFESADLFVFPGIQQEGQPLVVIEAMAAGLPVIFTNRGCLRDTVIDGKSGVEVPINDPEKLAERIVWLMNHPQTVKELGHHARQRYEALYTKTQHIENMIQVFTTACTEGTR